MNSRYQKPDTRSPETRNRCHSKRRSFLRYILAGVLCWPVIAFIREKRYRPPVKIQIAKTLKPGTSLIQERFVLFETDSGNAIAVSRECTHLGCTLKFSEKTMKFLCPCHQSMFEWDGRYIKGPARKDLVRLKVKRLKDQGGYEVEIPGAMLT